MLSTATDFPVPAPPPARAAREEITLLLVDDTDAVREVLETVLTFEGYRVVTASCAECALDVASRTRFDMLITDFEMPGMNGYALATILAQRNAALPVLLISGAELSLLPLTQVENRRWHFLPKPLKNKRLLQIIDQTCLR